MLLGRLRGVVGDRRRASRYPVRLFFSVSVLAGDESQQQQEELSPQTLVGRTRNLSESGVGFVVPSLFLGTGCLNDEGSTLRLMLDLPSGKIEIYVEPVRSQQLGESDEGSGHFVGARITHMSDAARARYISYLRGLRDPH
jgi:hypothetical protein